MKIAIKFLLLLILLSAAPAYAAESGSTASVSAQCGSVAARTAKDDDNTVDGTKDATQVGTTAGVAGTETDMVGIVKSN